MTRSARTRPASAAACLALACLLAGCEPAHEAEEGGRPPEPRPTADLDEIARLQALGYVDVVEDAPPVHERGVVARDLARSQGGLVYFTNTLDCSSVLMSDDGTVVNTWRWKPCEVWANSVLLPSGDVLAVHRSPGKRDVGGVAMKARSLLKLSWDGELLWQSDVQVHHDVDPLPDGRIAALTKKRRMIPAISEDRRTVDDFVSILDSEGRLLEEASITDMLVAAGDRYRIEDAFYKEAHRRKATGDDDAIDLIHANSVVWMRDPALAARDPLYDLDHVLVCMRHQNRVAIFDWPERKLVWSWGDGELMGPHDATLLPNGNVLIFDNGLGRGWSRVVEVEPRSGEIVWDYRSDPPESFVTQARGAAQYLPNGNVLITSSAQGRVFEVTRKGDVVWDFYNPHTDESGKMIVIARAKRVAESEDDGTRFQRSD